MFQLHEIIFPESMLSLPSRVDFRTQQQIDDWNEKQYLIGVDERVACRDSQQQEHTS